MTNTINNVPRELLERVLDYDGAVAIRQNARHELRAILSAPSPAGVDGLEVVDFHMGDAVSIRKLLATHVLSSRVENEHLGVAGAIRVTTWATKIGLTIEQRESNGGESARVLSAQAIIDGLRGEVERKTRSLDSYGEELDKMQESIDAGYRAKMKYKRERDHLAQRIGELEGLLNRVKVSLSLDDTEWGYSAPEKYKLLADIRAALSAGKEKQDEHN